jgi:hypothetical protein
MEALFLMSEHKLINVLTKDECEYIVDQIDFFKDQWIRRENGPFHYYTIGTATHLDIEPFDSISEETKKLIAYNNDFLKNNFSKLYDKVIKAIELEFGSAELVEDAPIPGFFCYGEPKPNSIERVFAEPMGGKTHIHQDEQFSSLDYIWSKYNDVEHETIGFTLPLETPEYGAAFLLWDQPDLGNYMPGSISDIYKSYNYNDNEGNVSTINDWISNKVPEVIEHLPGRMMLQKGPQWHATGFSVAPLSTDRRITLQGFGVKCDGVWRLFF